MEPNCTLCFFVFKFVFKSKFESGGSVSCGHVICVVSDTCRMIWHHRCQPHAPTRPRARWRWSRWRWRAVDSEAWAAVSAAAS